MIAEHAIRALKARTDDALPVWDTRRVERTRIDEVVWVGFVEARKIVDETSATSMSALPRCSRSRSRREAC